MNSDTIGYTAAESKMRMPDTSRSLSKLAFNNSQFRSPAAYLSNRYLFGELDLGDFADNSIDAFGDAYEYLMAMYAEHAFSVARRRSR